jgi:transcriptional regulator with XRE-family HTH domain
MELVESASVASAQSRMRRSPMPKTIRELREACGESEQQLADALGATLAEVTDLERGVARPSVPRLRLLTEHFGVREEEINLEPDRSTTLGEHLRDALAE